MKCQIGWIDDRGNPTYDSNEAVYMAHSHEPKWLVETGHPENRIIGYKPEITQSFPCCQEHYNRVQKDWLYGRGGSWEFELLAKE
jgi:hypothetical protein